MKESRKNYHSLKSKKRLGEQQYILVGLYRHCPKPMKEGVSPTKRYRVLLTALSPTQRRSSGLARRHPHNYHIESYNDGYDDYDEDTIFNRFQIIL